VEAGYTCNGETCNAAACGDGIVATGEECDDGNRSAGDGCSFLCRVEPGFDCSGAAGCRRTRCGDGIVEGDELCDDAGAVCSGAGTQNGQPCVTPEDYDACRADDGTCAPEGGDGCSADCQLEDGYKCELPGQACVASYCGDGLVEGTEQCDVGGAVCSGTDTGTLDDTPCLTQADIDACVADNGTCGGGAVCSGGALDGEPCITADQFAACAAQVGDTGCVAIAANGCADDCTLIDGFDCDAGAFCDYADATMDCCWPTFCGDGMAEGTEACDDGGAICTGSATMDGVECLEPADFAACEMDGGQCLGENGDGCADDCTVETFYRCQNPVDMPSVCRPIVQYVPIKRFNVTNVNPVGLSYDPDRRSFGGHKNQGSKQSIEMCLDGTVINQESTLAGPNGTIFDPDGVTVTELPVDCSENPGVEPCYDSPLRPDEVANSNILTLRGATYDPVTGDTLFVHATNLAAALLVQLPAGFDRNASVDIHRYGVLLPFDAYGLTVGEDGDLYVTDATTEEIKVLPRLRDVNGDPLPPADCSMEATPADVNCTSFDPVPDAARTRDAASVTNLDAIFTFPGESLVGIFNEYLGALEYTGYDMAGDPDPLEVTSSNYFSIYDIESTDPPERSAFPGVLFTLGEIGTSYVNAAQAAETAPDGGAFIVCTFTSSEDCQIFSRTCESDADCPPGTTCNLDGDMGPVGVDFCNAPGEARDDIFEVERDVFRLCTSDGDQNGMDCTASDTACLAQGGSCDQVGANDPRLLDVLANDTLSESACVDPRFTILAVCGDGVMQPYEMDTPDNCPTDTEPMPNGTVTFQDGEIDYDAPDDGSCGFFDTFTYTVDLGGGDIQTAQVRVAVNCLCGDAIVDGNEQCDDGDFNGAPGACVDNCEGAPEEQVLARCSEQCLLNVLCGDGYIVSPEECDDGNTENGDGCSSVCTRESECGNGIVEQGEDCDDGPSGSDSCNPNCTIPDCGDGNLDTQLGEQCDDGNLRVGDGCDAECMIETVCGNGVVEPGEDCDDGGTVPGDGCSASCQVENVCGNDDREGDEVCDGSDFGTCPKVGGVQIQCVNSQQGAPNICLCQNYCGDGTIGGAEECDDGEAGSDTCRGAAPDEGDPCTEIRCGDGVVDAGELCDDGNTNPADSCTNECRPPPSCGNGTVDPGEECDDGNNVSGDGCTATCQNEAGNCGDGIKQSDEQCDDGNTDSGDGCDSNCRIEGIVCGDGVVDPGEQCDDGNTTNGDGCSSSCRFELE
jgi:cysteine-rich repeat protein